MAAKITAKDVAEQAGVNLDDLKQEYSDDDVREGLSELCDPWRLAGDYLKLTPGQLNAIDENHKKVEEKRIAVLQTRKEDRFDATYFLLVEAFVAMRKAKKALKVCEIFKESHSSRPSNGQEAGAVGTLSKEPGLGMEAATHTGKTDKKAQGGAMPNFSFSMNTQELAQWLHQKIKDPDYHDDIKKLEVNKINGKAFLRLPTSENLQKKLDLSIGGEEILISIAEEVMKESAGGAASLPPIEPDVPWCSTTTPRRISTDSDIQDQAAEDGMHAAYVPQDALWEGYKELHVEFLNKIPNDWTCGDGEAMNTTNILGWANEWNLKGDGKIPKFVKAKGGGSQIRVLFNNKGTRNSCIGKGADSVKHDKPTMNLDLHTGGISNDYKRHVVIHEFGHALGLGHEHQRSNFWNSIKKYTDVPKMKKALGVSDTQFKIDWDIDHDSESGHHTEYDPDSIMHYWFKTEWLTHGYHDESKVKKDRDSKKLSDKEASALLGVHKRHEKLANEPSELDIKLLKELYGSSKESGAPPLVGTGQAGQRRMATDESEVEVEIDYNKYEVKNHLLNRLEWMEGNDKKTVKIYDDSAHEWERIGGELGLEVGTLRGINRNSHDDVARLKKVLEKWYYNANNLPNKNLYPKTWTGLITLLKNSELGDVAKKVHSALSATTSNIRGNL